MQYLIPILLAIPILGAIACALDRQGRAARWIALLSGLLCVAVVIEMLRRFDWDGGVQFVVTLGQVPGINSVARLGVDAISLWLVALTVFLQPLVVLASFQSIRERQTEYYLWMQALLSAMLGVFVARDAIVFYVFFELTLVPMFFIIGIWGGPQRRLAAGRFFLFTFSGSIFTLAAIVYVLLKYSAGRLEGDDWDIANLVALAQHGLRNPASNAVVIPPLSATELMWVSLGLLVGFAVKVPLVPVHTWLPLAHTEAPTAGSVVLAGVLLKLGTYGILRFVVPIGFAPAGVIMTPLVRFVAVLCLIGIIYGALVAWVQHDIKKLVAYSSVSHLGFCVLGLAALNHEGVQGSVLYMINHGLSTGALFLVVGMIYDRYHTRDINELSGLGRRMPILAFFLGLFTLSSIGLPGLNGFVSEFLTILGAFRSQHLGFAYGAVAALGIILGALYMLHMVARVLFGPLKEPGHGGEPHNAHAQGDEAGVSRNGLGVDLGAREVGLLVPLAVAVVVLGVIPGKLLRTLDGPVSDLIGPAGRPAARQAQVEPAGGMAAADVNVPRVPRTMEN